MPAKKLSELGRGLVERVLKADSIPGLAEVIHQAATVKKRKHLAQWEYNALLELGEKKERLLHAQGYR